MSVVRFAKVCSSIGKFLRDAQRLSDGYSGFENILQWKIGDFPTGSRDFNFFYIFVLLLSLFFVSFNLIPWFFFEQKSPE